MGWGGLRGMIGVDKIGEIRRAYFEQDRSIKEIVRTLSVSRATVRKVVRGHNTEFKYERGVQPSPKLGDWIEVLTEILEKERHRGGAATAPKGSAVYPGAPRGISRIHGLRLREVHWPTGCIDSSQPCCRHSTGCRSLGSCIHS